MLGGPSMDGGGRSGEEGGDAAVRTGIPNWVSSLEEDLDCKVMIVLRDDRKLLGYLRSFDQFGNLVTEDTKERLVATGSADTAASFIDSVEGRAPDSAGVEVSCGQQQDSEMRRYGIYADVQLGTVIVRGENIVLFGVVEEEPAAAASDGPAAELQQLQSGRLVKRPLAEVLYRLEDTKRLDKYDNQQALINCQAEMQAAGLREPEGETTAVGPTGIVTTTTTVFRRPAGEAAATPPSEKTACRHGMGYQWGEDW
eukprot:GHVS01004740.1.p1 GENE.GHVS01004740.1~~GHVS01004740.1.p1  ORF type:complete len:255 (-),score=69.39 GHVS01004740.1:215-979(-)